MSSTQVTDLREAGFPTWLVDAISDLARDKDRSLDGCLLEVGDSVVAEGTKATCRCHFVPRDGNGRTRIKPLVNKLAQQAIDYCIPRTRIQEAQARYNKTGSTEGIVQLHQEALSLFTKLQKSGEGGELLLYLLLEVGLGLPQLLCKMPLKTSSQMHVHGVDGIHGMALESGGLALYWGESKLYASVNQAIDACFESIAPYLCDSGGGAAQRDLTLLRDNIDTGTPELTEALLQYLLGDTPESMRVEFRGACLIGFSLADYPDPFAASGKAVADEVNKAILKWYQRVGQKVKFHNLAEFSIEVFCVPFPSVDEFREAIKEALYLQ